MSEVSRARAAKEQIEADTLQIPPDERIVPVVNGVKTDMSESAPFTVTENIGSYRPEGWTRRKDSGLVVLKGAGVSNIATHGLRCTSVGFGRFPRRASTSAAVMATRANLAAHLQWVDRGVR